MLCRLTVLILGRLSDIDIKIDNRKITKLSKGRTWLCVLIWAWVLIALTMVILHGSASILLFTCWVSSPLLSSNLWFVGNRTAFLQLHLDRWDLTNLNLLEMTKKLDIYKCLSTPWSLYKKLYSCNECITHSANYILGQATRSWK